MSESLHDSDLIENVTYDELQVGQSATLRRTLSNADIQAFALVSGDVNPAHVDPAYANGTRFHGVIVHGMFAGALISTVLGTKLPGPGTIYVGQTLQFLRPVGLGDRITVTVTVKTKEANNRSFRQAVVVSTDKVFLRALKISLAKCSAVGAV